ncbi:Protein lsb5 [Hypsizygus marmoreus]|uniref:Protein lsb5 n=1 Tax=Hypsizygus marmoreus TaxID=39966 RepID=A0A369KB25_HYPMA|nr:Protein lsb5 [Hypsizygus marmoreus]
MSAFNFARQALGLEKPHSSITDWVDILTSSNIAEEAYDGIPELVDSINLQASGPTEASRALRKKLKHGNPHQQYRSLVLLKALVENCGTKFQTTFADGQLTDALKNISADSTADKRVRKKLLLVLASWRDQFKSDPSMSLIAGLYSQCSREGRRLSQQEVSHLIGLPTVEDKKRAEKEEAKKTAKREKEEAKERARKEAEERRQKERNAASRSRRAPFNFEKDKPKVLASIVDASQATSNLHNAITLVNPETDSLKSNERVQECLTKAKQARKPVVRYIQLVENEELIGTLIETNERIIAALEMYDKLVAQSSDSAGPKDVDGVTAGLAAAQISMPENEVNRLQERQRVAVDRVKQAGKNGVQDSHTDPYADLQNLDFGGGPNNLQRPLRPSTLSDDGQDDNAYNVRGSLSEFSDYDSSDEETHVASGSSPRKRGGRDYVDVSDDPEDDNFPGSGSAKAPLVHADDDPFADPFADEVAVGPAKRW